MEPQFCADEVCIKHTEHRGGRFFYCQADGKTYCEDCYGLHTVKNDGKNLWNFVTSHGDGKRTHIKSLAELRAYEKRTGTSNQLANNYESTCNQKRG